LSIAGVILAAGPGSRFGRPKAPVVINGERLVDHAVACLREAGCDPVIVVLGAWVGDVLHADIVVNDAWTEGMGSSLRKGLDALEHREQIDSTLVTLVDLPGLTAAGVRRIAEADGELIVATFDGERGHPVRFARRHWSSIRESAVGDEGARTFLARRTDITFVEIGDVASGYDIDIPPE